MTTYPEALRLAEVSPYLEGGERGRWIIEAAAELRRLHTDAEESEALRERLSALLRNTAIALRGPEPELTRWSWHDLPELATALKAQRDALLEALLRIESAVDWYLGRSSFTQTTQLKGLKHSVNVRKELFAAHDEVRAAIKAVEENT